MRTSFFQTGRADRLYKILSRLVILAAFLVTLWDFILIQKMTIRLSLVNVAGSGLFLIGVYIRVMAIRTLGKYFQTDLKTLKDHRLVKNGIYKRIRHPAYLGTFLFCVGITLVFSSFYGFLIMLGLFLVYLYRTKLEENMLLEKFGDEYLKYMKETKKMIPYVY